MCEVEFYFTTKLEKHFCVNNFAYHANKVSCVKGLISLNFTLTQKISLETL